VLDSENITKFEMTADKTDRDAMTIARLQELIEKMEETAYAMVRLGESNTGMAIFMAVAAAEKSRDSRLVQSS
jgi:hypothetical protein